MTDSDSLFTSLRQLHEQWRAKADDALYVPEDCAEVYLRCADALASLLALAESQQQEIERLRQALRDVAATHTHYGLGPHCTCSQRDIVRTALSQKTTPHGEEKTLARCEGSKATQRTEPPR
jgi:hypothetical protein